MNSFVRESIISIAQVYTRNSAQGISSDKGSFCDMRLLLSVASIGRWWNNPHCLLSLNQRSYCPLT